MSKFYVYFWLRESGSPYYVGKGCNDRAFIKEGHFCPPPPRDRVILQYYTTEQEAFNAEIFFIALFGRKDIHTGCLRNRTNGGDGVRGFIASKELRQLWSQQKLGLKYSDSHRKSMSEAAKRRSPEHLERIAASLRGRPGTRRGAKLTEETRRKISLATKGRVFTAEHRLNLSLSHRKKSYV